MDKSTVVIKGSFKGILGEFIKNILILLATYVLYIISKNTKASYYAKYSIDSFFGFAMEFKEMKAIAILSFVFVLYLILAIIGIHVLYKTIMLLYETQRTITIDFISGKILAKTYSFPFNKIIDEHKFNEIITVSITQSIAHKIFDSGDFYIEYLTCSKVDSQLRAMEIPYINEASKIKQNLI
jgi:hypothetical protein